MGTDPGVVDDLSTAVQAWAIAGLGVDGVHVQARGQPPVEQHWMADIRRDVFSVSKTFTSVAVGIAQDEGLLDLEDHVLDHLGHLAPKAASGLESVSIRQLLLMSSGIDYRWEDPDADHAGDAALDILSTPLATEPGTTFAYRGANTYLLSRIVHACSGLDLRDYLMPRPFAPLSIGNPQWQRCPPRILPGRRRTRVAHRGDRPTRPRPTQPGPVCRAPARLF